MRTYGSGVLLCDWVTTETVRERYRSKEDPPWAVLTAVHFLIDGWFEHVSGTYALFNRPWDRHPSAEPVDFNRTLEVLLTAGADAAGHDGEGPLALAVEPVVLVATAVMPVAMVTPGTRPQSASLFPRSAHRRKGCSPSP